MNALRVVGGGKEGVEQGFVERSYPGFGGGCRTSGWGCARYAFEHVKHGDFKRSGLLSDRSGRIGVAKPKPKEAIDEG